MIVRSYPVSLRCLARCTPSHASSSQLVLVSRASSEQTVCKTSQRGFCEIQRTKSATSAGRFVVPVYRSHARRSRLEPVTSCCSSRFSTTATKGKEKEKAGQDDHQSAAAEAVADAPFPVFTTVAEFRQWRQDQGKSDMVVGFVPTMGALHDGHLGLVRQSLAETDLTVVSIFVNPAQFAPTEDLSSYPRTLPDDIAKLVALGKESAEHVKGNGRSQATSKRGVAAIFAPTVPQMYPSPDGKPFTQHVAEQQGAFVEVLGLQSQMEGASRPTFFRGVATVCTKLFHVVQPDIAYFGQKDIQQAIILRRLVSDLLFPHPPSAQAVRVLPTARDARDGLALSSRNTYLTPASRRHAPALYRALKVGESVWASMSSPSHAEAEEPGNCITKSLDAARASLDQSAKAAREDGVHLEPLYITLNDPVTLADLEAHAVQTSSDADPAAQGNKSTGRGAILSGAAMIREGDSGRATRLIDNILLNFSLD